MLTDRPSFHGDSHRWIAIPDYEGVAQLSQQTRGSLEAAVANAMTRFQREQQGRGPADVRAHLFGETLVVRSSGIFTAIEDHLSATEDGKKLIKSARQELRGINKADVEALVAEILGCRVARSYFDVDVDAAEQMEVYVMAEDVERRLARTPGRSE